MSYCPECGEEVDEDASFCPSCGTSLKGEEPRTEGRGGKIAKGIDPEDFLHNPELIMVVSGILMILGSIGSWYSLGPGGIYYLRGWAAGGIRLATAWMGLILLYSSAVELDYVDALERFVPPLNVASICGSVGLIGGLGALTAPSGGGWGLILALIGSIVALFAAFRAYERSQEKE